MRLPATRIQPAMLYDRLSLQPATLPALAAVSPLASSPQLYITNHSCLQHASTGSAHAAVLELQHLDPAVLQGVQSPHILQTATHVMRYT
jgi:hypothetical protein